MLHCELLYVDVWCLMHVFCLRRVFIGAIWCFSVLHMLLYLWASSGVSCYVPVASWRVCKPLTSSASCVAHTLYPQVFFGLQMWHGAACEKH